MGSLTQIDTALNPGHDYEDKTVVNKPIPILRNGVKGKKRLIAGYRT